MTRIPSKDEGLRAFLRPPVGNMAFYPREYLATVRTCVMKAWPASGPNAIKREVALTLLADPELRLRVCHLEEILRGRQLSARVQANGIPSSLPSANGSTAATGNGSGAHVIRDLPMVQLQTALADPSFAALFELDTAVNEPDWGMQVLWLNMAHLQKELGLPSPPPPPPTVSNAAAPPTPPHAGATTSPASAAAAGATALPSLNEVSTTGASPLPAAAAHVANSEFSSLLPAIESFFPNNMTDDYAYLAVAACYCLATSRRNGARSLGLHMTELVVQLRSLAAADGRLAAALQRLAASGGGAAALTMRLTDLLTSPRARQAFRVSDSVSRGGEHVVSLAMDQLVRGVSGGGAAAAAPAKVGRQVPYGGGLPLDLWQSAVAAFGGRGDSAQATSVSRDEGLPVFLFEYEAASDLYGRDDRSAPTATQRVQYGNGAAAAAALARPRNGSAPAAAAAGSPTAANNQQQSSNWTGNGTRVISSASAPAAPTSPQTRLPHAAAANSDAAIEPLSLPSAASDPGIADSGLTAATAAAAAETLFRRNTEPPVGAGAGGAVASSSPYGSVGGAGGDIAGMSGLMSGFGAAWGAGRSPPSVAAATVSGVSEGPVASSGGSFTGGSRFPLFTGNRSTDALFQNSMGGSSIGGGLGSSVGGAGVTSLSALAASPGGPTREIAVPQAIADVWSNAGNGGGGGGANGTAAVVGSVDAGLGGVFSMSPTQESLLWERVVAGRSAANPLPTAPLGTRNGTPAAAAAVADLAGLGLGLGYPGNTSFGSFNDGFGFGNFGGGGGGSFGSAGGAAPLYGGGGGGLVVGSAPPAVFPPPFFQGGGGGGGGAGLGGGMGVGASLTDYAPWHSPPADLMSASFAGRSAPADDAAAASWILAHGARAAAVSGGGGAGGLAAEAAGGAAALRMATGPSTSVSEESEEAARLMGGLDLDPMALTIEAIIGFDSSNQMDHGAVGRAVLSSPTATAAAAAAAAPAAKGLIAAAAGPKPAAAASAGVPSPSSRSFTSAAGTIAPFVGGGGGSGGGSHHSSLDCGDSMHGNGGGGAATAAAVLTGWSAMAARGASLPPGVHPNVAGMQLAAATAAAAAGGAGRLSGSPLPPSMMTSGQFAATMAAMGVTAAGGGGGVSGGGALAAAMSGGGGGPAVRDVFGGKVLHPKLTPRVREEICHLVRTVPGLKPEDFDDGVLHQLTLKRSEEEAVAALRQLASENLCGIQHMAAYINHIIKNFHNMGAAGGSVGGAAGPSLPSATVRANSTPVSSKAILQKLPLRVYRRLEEVIAKCSYMEWKHFDAGVVKVMAQLAEIGEEDVFEELELLKCTDLSNVEYMPAYLNKRLNNRLWSRRKMLSSAGPVAQGS